MATATGVWEPNDAWFGVMYRESVVVGSAKDPWTCYDTARDPGEHDPHPGSACPSLLEIGTNAFPLKAGSGKTR